MADEQTIVQPEAITAPDVSGSDLGSGSEQVNNTTTQDTEVIETTSEAEKERELQEHKERSARGRKVAEKVDKLEALLEAEREENRKFRETLLSTMHKPVPEQPFASTPDEELPEYVGTADDVLKILDARERKRAQAQEMAQAQQARYATDIQRQFEKYKSDNPDIAGEVEKFVLEGEGRAFNKPWTGDPVKDCEIITAKAEAVIYRKKQAEKTIPGARESNPQSHSVTQKVVDKRVETVNITDPAAKRLAESMVASGQFTQDEINSVLRG